MGMEHWRGIMTIRKNWLHLDFKGIVPEPGRFLNSWLPFIKALGYNGLVLEYDCRVPWKTWPAAGHPLYTPEDVRRINAAGQACGLEIIPLIQTQGHLEWVLQNAEYQHLRENGSLRELCPLHPESLPYILSWIDEAAEMHPGAKHIHLGSDETWDLATCPQCSKRQDRRGKMGLYLDHVAAACRHAIGLGLVPIIWGDMFWRENAPELISELPPEVILCDWDYYGVEKVGHELILKNKSHRIIGASALRCITPDYSYTCQTSPEQRAANVKTWLKTGHDLVHTVWSRPGNHRPLYPPWFAVGNLFALAGGASEFSAEAEASGIPEQCRRWRSLANRFQALSDEYDRLSKSKLTYAATASLTGITAIARSDEFEECLQKNRLEVEDWCEQVRAFFRENAISDAEEFIAQRTAFILPKGRM
jgi:hypothetical protein